MHAVQCTVFLVYWLLCYKVESILMLNEYFLEHELETTFKHFK